MFFYYFSAGIGRTGAYILIDAMLKQMKSKGELNISAYLRHVRTQRSHLVQTEEQYVFVHDALAEAVAAGETNISKSYLSRYISSLQSSFTTDENSIPWQLLDRQFKLATVYQPQESQFTSALKPCNQLKNQNFDYLPIEVARVSIVSKPGLEGSDYINASWIPGYNNVREFIITQHPMEQTCADFWQMIWDHNVSMSVILSSIQQPEFGVFWPLKHVDFDAFRVQLVDETSLCGYDTKDFKLSSFHNDYILNCRIVYCPDWPRSCSSPSRSNNDATDLIRVVQKQLRVHQSPNSPLVVMDRFGGTESAIFCSLTTLLKQLEREDHVDIYQCIKIMHNQRPGIWRSQDDILYIYKVLEAICISQYSTQMVQQQQMSNSASTGTFRRQYLTGNGRQFHRVIDHHHHHLHPVEASVQETSTTIIMSNHQPSTRY